MAGLNRVILGGRLGKDPEIRSFQNGDKVANFSLATSETWRDKQTGERKERTEWHNIKVLNENLIKIVEQYVGKGSQVIVEGSLQTRKWEKDGIERYTTEIVLGPYRSVLVLVDRAEGGGDRGESGSGYGSGHSTGTQRQDGARVVAYAQAACGAVARQEEAQECGAAHYEGDCFVFDDRRAVDAALQPQVDAPAQP